MSRKPRQKSLSIPIGASVPSASMERYFKIPDWLFLDKSVGWGAKLVYAVINRFSETYTFPIGGYAFIQDVLDISRAQLFRRLDELELAGFINREKSEKYARRIQIMPRHNTLAQAFYEAEDGAFERWNLFRKSLTSETLRKNKESHPCDPTTNVLSHPCDIKSLTSETVEEGRPYCIREPIREPIKNENHGCADLSSFSKDQNQNLPTTEALQVTQENPLVPPAAHFEEKYSESQSNLNLEDDVLVFMRNIYKRQRDIKIKPKSLTPTEALIRRRESEYGPEDFRRGLICYLSQSHDSVVKKQWPISWYLSDPSKNMPDSPFPSPATSSPHPLPTSVSSDATANAPAPFLVTEPDPLRNPLTFIERWNTIVYDSPVDVDSVLSFTMAGLKKAINGGDFQKCFERVFEKCQRMNTHKPNTITFDGLFMGYVPMWQKIYSGTEDWKMGKEDVFAQVQAAAEREERGTQRDAQ